MSAQPASSTLRARLAARRMFRRSLAALAVILFFLIGYNATTANTQACRAQYSPTPTIPGSALPPAVPFVCTTPCTYPFVPLPCSLPMSTAVTSAAVEMAYYSALTTSSEAVENYISMAVDTLVQTVFSRLEQAEQDIADWFDTYWYYNYKPSLQAKVEQANTAGMDQAQQIASLTDADLQNRNTLDKEEDEALSKVGQSDTAGEEACAVATSASTFGNANTYGRAMRRALQTKAIGDTLNRTGTPGARGVAAVIAQHEQEYQNFFCDPLDNAGQNVCGESDPKYYNADIQVTGRLFNTLTVPVDKDDRDRVALEHQFDNMMGHPRTAPMSEDMVGSASGKQTWVERRSYAARKNAARSVLNLVAGWRMPGGADENGQKCVDGKTPTGEPCAFVAALREAAGVPLSDLTDNPSYREIMRAMSVDRFSSGDYAIDKIGSAERQEMEKVVLNAMYLMQLRDYYELLERTALTLAVQVSVLAEHAPLPEIAHRTNAGGKP